MKKELFLCIFLLVIFIGNVYFAFCGTFKFNEATSYLIAIMPEERKITPKAPSPGGSVWEMGPYTSGNGSQSTPGRPSGGNNTSSSSCGENDGSEAYYRCINYGIPRDK